MESGEVFFYPPWEQAIANFQKAGFTHGSLITHVWLYANFGVKLPRQTTPFVEANELRLEFLRQFTPFRNKLLTEFNMDLESVPGPLWDETRGYRIIFPEEQTGLAMRDGMREIAKAIQRTACRLHHVDASQLTQEQQQENRDAMAKVAMLRNLARKQLRGPTE